MRPILIKNGNIINEDAGLKADVLLRDGKIELIGDHIDLSSHPDVQLIDATGLYLLPGAVDPHVHFHLPTPAGFSADDFHSGSLAALAGGTTTIIDFVTPRRDQSIIKALDDRMEEAETSLIDYSLHMSVTSWSPEIKKEMAKCAGLGITSFKAYLAYRDTIGIGEGELGNVMLKAAELGALVMVHCEDGAMISKLKQEFISNGKLTPEFHALSRPDDTEADAVLHVIDKARQSRCNTYIVHVSSAKAMRHLIAARKEGLAVHAETCPQYLLLGRENYRKDIPASLAYIMSPPLRSAIDQEVLWDGLVNGQIEVVATDHCPFNLAGQKDLDANDFTTVPNGTGGVEFRLPLLHTFGVLTGKFSINRMVAMASAMPARIFGLWPQKGVIAMGSDADIVLWDPAKKWVITAKDQYQRCDHTIYEGMKMTGAPHTVIVSGRVAMEEGRLVSSDLKGRFLKRK